MGFNSGLKGLNWLGHGLTKLTKYAKNKSCTKMVSFTGLCRDARSTEYKENKEWVCFFTDSGIKISLQPGQHFKEQISPCTACSSTFLVTRIIL
jgi:hypothetical protein